MKDFPGCDCMELGAQVCSAYENWCSEVQDEIWWDSLTDEERESYKIRLCNNCSRGFEPTDDDGEQEVCADCVDWLDNFEEFGINF